MADDYMNESQESALEESFSNMVTQVEKGKSVPHMPTNMKYIPPSADQKVLLGPKWEKDADKKTLVIDLDETLVHSSFKPISKPDIILEVEIENNIC